MPRAERSAASASRSMRLGADHVDEPTDASAMRLAAEGGIEIRTEGVPIPGGRKRAPNPDEATVRPGDDADVSFCGCGSRRNETGLRGLNAASLLVDADLIDLSPYVCQSCRRHLSDIASARASLHLNHYL